MRCHSQGSGYRRWGLYLALTLLASKTSAATNACDAAPEPLLQSYIQAYDSLGPHRSGSRGDHATARFVQKELNKLGFDITLQSFPVPDHAGLSAMLNLDGYRVPLLAQPPLRADYGHSGRLFYWNYAPGIPAPILSDDAILLIDLPHARYTSFGTFAIRQLLPDLQSLPVKPMGVILITNGDTGEAQLLNVDPRTQAPPMFLVAPKHAARLRSKAVQNGRVRIDFGWSGGSATANNVVATHHSESRWWVLSTPISGWGYATGERAPGFAMTLYLARWIRCRYPEQALKLVFTSGHELDNAGSKLFLQHLAPKPKQVAVWLHLGAGWGARDHLPVGGKLIPQHHANPLRMLMAHPEFIPRLSADFSTMPGLAPISLAKRPAFGELRDIHGHGYKAIGIFGAHSFHHIVDDRVDNVLMEEVVRVTDAFRSSIINMAQPGFAGDGSLLREAQNAVAW